MRQAIRRAAKDRARWKTHHATPEARASALRLLASGASLREAAEAAGVTRFVTSHVLSDNIQMTLKRKPSSGRPTLAGKVGGGESRRVSVRLTDALIAAAEELGDGSVSVGVRAAIEIAGVTRQDGGGASRVGSVGTSHD